MIPDLTPSSVCVCVYVCLSSVFTRRAGLFSQNEELEDIQTKSLKFLMLPFYKAEALQVFRGDGAGGIHAGRLDALRSARVEVDRFLSLNDRIGTLDASTKEVYMRENPVDAATLRAEKVARFTREKQLRQKLGSLQDRRMEERRRALQAAEGCTIDGIADDVDVGPDEDDEEEEFDDEREMWLVQLQLAHSSALEMIGTLVRHLGSIRSCQSRFPSLSS